MDTKRCTKCGETKELVMFSVLSRSKDGRQPKCKACNGLYHIEHRKRILARMAERRNAIDPEVIKRNSREWYAANKDAVAKADKARRAAESPDKRQVRLARLNRYRAEHAEANKERQRIWYRKNRDRHIRRTREYLEANRDKSNARLRQRKKEEPLFALACSMRTMLSTRIKQMGYAKTSKAQAIIGCSFAELKRHLERQFLKGMTWGNYGKWHIDHRIPLASATSQEQVIYLCHYLNLQPLWAADNISKSDAMPSKVQLHLAIS